MTRSSNYLKVNMFVPDKGAYTADLPVSAGVNHGRFKRTGMPPILGAHLFTETKNGIHLCTLQINNGTLNVDKTWHGIVRYSSLVLRSGVGSGMTIVSEWGPVGTSIAVYSGDTANPSVLLARQLITLTFAICTPDKVAEAKSLLLYEDKTDWQPLKGNYGPLESTLPSVDGLDYDSIFSPIYSNLIQAWALNKPNPSLELHIPKLGARMPMGDDLGYMFGGQNIDPSHGFERNRKAVLCARWKHARWMDRMATALYSEKGEMLSINSFASPLHLEQVKEGPGQWRRELPMFLEGPWDHARYKWFNPGPSSDANIAFKYESVYISHYIRAIKNAIIWWEYTGAEAAAHALQMMYEAMRFDWSDRADEKAKPSYPGEWIYDSLAKFANQVNTAPHGGIWFDRAYGWAMYLGAMVYRTGYQPMLTKSWLRSMVVIGEKAELPNGIIHANYHPPEMPGNVKGCQTFHEALIMNGWFAACKAIGKNAGTHLAKVCKTLYDNPNLPPIPDPYNPDKSWGPPHWVWTHIDGKLIEVKSQYTGLGDGKSVGDPAHVVHALALCYRATNDPHWLNVSLKHWQQGHTSLKQRLDWLKLWTDKSWGGELQSVLEKVVT